MALPKLNRIAVSTPLRIICNNYTVLNDGHPPTVKNALIDNHVVTFGMRSALKGIYKLSILERKTEG
jgi:hypothetical protein